MNSAAAFQRLQLLKVQRSILATAAQPPLSMSLSLSLSLSSLSSIFQNKSLVRTVTSSSVTATTRKTPTRTTNSSSITARTVTCDRYFGSMIGRRQQEQQQQPNPKVTITMMTTTITPRLARHFSATTGNGNGSSNDSSNDNGSSFTAKATTDASLLREICVIDATDLDDLLVHHEYDTVPWEWNRKQYIIGRPVTENLIVLLQEDCKSEDGEWKPVSDTLLTKHAQLVWNWIRQGTMNSCNETNSQILSPRLFDALYQRAIEYAQDERDWGSFQTNLKPNEEEHEDEDEDEDDDIGWLLEDGSEEKDDDDDDDDDEDDDDDDDDDKVDDNDSDDKEEDDDDDKVIVLEPNDSGRIQETKTLTATAATPTRTKDDHNTTSSTTTDAGTDATAAMTQGVFQLTLIQNDPTAIMPACPFPLFSNAISASYEPPNCWAWFVAEIVTLSKSSTGEIIPKKLRLLHGKERQELELQWHAHNDRKQRRLRFHGSVDSTQDVASLVEKPLQERKDDNDDNNDDDESF